MKKQYLGLKRATLDFGNGNTAEVVMGGKFSLENHPEVDRAVNAGALRELESEKPEKPTKPETPKTTEGGGEK